MHVLECRRRQRSPSDGHPWLGLGALVELHWCQSRPSCCEQHRQAARPNYSKGDELGHGASPCSAEACTCRAVHEHAAAAPVAASRQRPAGTAILIYAVQPSHDQWQDQRFRVQTRQVRGSKCRIDTLTITNLSIAPYCAQNSLRPLNFLQRLVAYSCHSPAGHSFKLYSGLP